MNRPAAVNVDEASPFEAQAFFEAIPSDPERAMALLRTQVPSDGPPTPRAAVFLENGEWDDSTTIAVTFVSSDTCVGRENQQKWICIFSMFLLWRTQQEHTLMENQ